MSCAPVRQAADLRPRAAAHDVGRQLALESLSTSTTSASRSWSLHGVRTPNECAHPAALVGERRSSARPRRRLRTPSAAGTRSPRPAAPALDPSARSVSASVVHTSGACHRTNGGCGTGRGSGIAVRPPTVCPNATDPPPSPSLGLAVRSTGSPTARGTSRRPGRAAPSSPPSAGPLVAEARDRRSARPRRRPSPAACWRTGTRPVSAGPGPRRPRRSGPAAARPSATAPGPYPSLSGPHTESEGIHDSDVVVALTRIRTPPGRFRIRGAMTPRTRRYAHGTDRMPDVRRRSGADPNYGMRHEVRARRRRPRRAPARRAATSPRSTAPSPPSRRSARCSATTSSTPPWPRCAQRQAELVSGQRGEQRRLVTVLFADLVDFTVLSRQLDAEDTRDVVDAYFARWQAAIEEHGGVVEKFIGDAVMAVFGLQPLLRGRRPPRGPRRRSPCSTTSTTLNAERRAPVRRARCTCASASTPARSSSAPWRAGRSRVRRRRADGQPGRRLQAAAPVDGVLISDRHPAPGPRRVRRRRPCPACSSRASTSRSTPTSWSHERPRGLPARPARRRRGRRDRAPSAGTCELRFLQDRLLGRRRRGRAGGSSRRRATPASASRGCCCDFDPWLAEPPEAVWWFRGRASHVEQNRANALLRDLLATRLEIARERPADVVREQARGRASPWPTATGRGGGTRGARSSGAGSASTSGPTRRPRAGPDRPAERCATRRTVALGRVLRAGSRAAQPVVDPARGPALGRRRRRCAGSTPPTPCWRDAPVLVVATARPTLLEERPRWGEGLDHHVRLDAGAAVAPGEPDAGPRDAAARRRPADGARRPGRRLRPRATRSTSRSWSPGSSTPGVIVRDEPHVARRRRAGRPRRRALRRSRACCRRASTR